MFYKISFVCICFFVIGCSGPVSFHEVDLGESWLERHNNILDSQEISHHSKTILKTHFLEDSFEDNHWKTLRSLYKDACQQKQRNTVFSIAEISYYYGTKTQDTQFYIASMKCAYFYLFDERLGPLPSPQDPRYRFACDLYNMSLSRYISMHQPNKINLELLGWDITYHGFVHKKQDFGYFLLADNYKVKGMNHLHRRYGLGAPLIAVRKEIVDPKGIEKYYIPEEQGFPATIVAKIFGNIYDFQKTVVSLEIYDSMHTEYVKIGDQKIILESNYTVPMTYVLKLRGEDKQFNPLRGLFSAEEEQHKTGVLMLAPYEKGKIPVILTHGLASRPLTWLQMLNDLNCDRELRRHFQFWVFGYPTGNPILYSAHTMRTALKDVYRELDPEGKNPNLQQTVLIGHSMGGVLSRTMVQDSKDNLISFFSKKMPLEKIPFTEEERKLVEAMFIFKPLPFVTRAIFIAAPHRGSDLADYSIVQLLTGLIELPKKIKDAHLKFIKAVKNQLQYDDQLQDAPTSVKGLSPNNYFMATMVNQPIAVKYHSIIGNIKEGDIKEGSDGVVPYSSAHLEGATSEYIVPEGHSCTAHPLTIKETRRILLQHVSGLLNQK